MHEFKKEKTRKTGKAAAFKNGRLTTITKADDGKTIAKTVGVTAGVTVIH